MIINAKCFRTLTDGSERSLPAGSVGSIITCTHAGSNLVIHATVNGIRGEGGRNVGFAQLKMSVAPTVIGLDFVVEFRAQASLPRRWSVVLTTDVTERIDRERGDGAIMTWQASFEPGADEQRFSLSDFKPVIRGREITGDFNFAQGAASLKTLGFQITRNATPGGRDNLDPIEADLVIASAVLEFRRSI